MLPQTTAQHNVPGGFALSMERRGSERVPAAGVYGWGEPFAPDDEQRRYDHEPDERPDQPERLHANERAVGPFGTRLVVASCFNDIQLCEEPMTSYHPDNRNRPHREPIPPGSMRARRGLGAGAWMAVALAALLIVAIVLYALNQEDEDVATTSPPATTGQQTDAPKPAPAPEQTPAPKPAPKAQ